METRCITANCDWLAAVDLLGGAEFTLLNYET
jgi:hypothetical protein